MNQAMPTQVSTTVSEVVKRIRKVPESAKSPKLSVHQSTSDTLLRLAEQANGSGRQRVQWKDIIDFAVNKVTPADLKKLREDKTTATDRFDDMFSAFRLKHPEATREEFLSKLMSSVDPKAFQS